MTHGGRPPLRSQTVALKSYHRALPDEASQLDDIRTVHASFVSANDNVDMPNESVEKTLTDD